MTKTTVSGNFEHAWHLLELRSLFASWYNFLPSFLAFGHAVRTVSSINHGNLPITIWSGKIFGGMADGGLSITLSPGRSA